MIVPILTFRTFNECLRIVVLRLHFDHFYCDLSMDKVDIRKSAIFLAPSGTCVNTNIRLLWTLNV